MRGTKLYGIVAAAFMAGAFVASPELRAYAAATIGSDDIINESILSEDIKNSQVKASDIATDAVGASEIQGVTKLIFAQCTLTNTEKTTSVPAQDELNVSCSINGVDIDDTAVATLGFAGFSCFVVARAETDSNEVDVFIKNDCNSATPIGSNTSPIGIIVFDK